jgi:N-methylhydantoinase B
LQALNELSATELRRRLAQLPDGRYRSVCWTQWGDELLETPCVLTVDAGRLVFDLAGAPPQVPFFVNSQPFIVLSQFLAMFCPEYVPDLPFNSGVPDCFELRSPEATVVNAQRPAPVGAGHVHIAIGVSEVMMQCVRLAVSAAPEPPFPAACVQGWNAMSATAPSSWGGVGPDGRPDGWMFLEGTLTGSPAAWGRDGVDAHHYILPTVGSEDGGVPPKIADIEVTEAWHPIFVTECRYRRGTGGAGRWRAGSGVVVSFETEGAERLTGQMLGLRPRIPLEGAAGGLPGDRSEFLRTAGDGPAEQLRLDAANVELRAGEAFTVRVANGGGVGDPLDRDVALVTDDVSAGVLDAGAVGEIYGVVFAPDGRPDAAATVATRDRMRRARLGRARPAVAPTGETPLVAVARDLDPAPLYPGVVQRGPVAFAAMSGAPLAVAPAHWTDGCPTIEAPVPGAGIAVVERSYLDPRTGRLLHVEAVPAGVGRSFDVLPDRWTAHPTATP